MCAIVHNTGIRKDKPPTDKPESVTNISPN